MSDPILYAKRVENTTVLGPFHRAVLWVHGCCFDCEGCLAENYRNGPFLSASPRELADWFLGTGVEHITISGGEPFLQAEALARMIAFIRESRDVGVMIYSGFTYEELLHRAGNDPGVKSLLAAADLLIDGRYDSSLDDGRPFVGSSNQRIIPLTDRYRPVIDGYFFSDGGRKIQLRLEKDQTLLIGVPSKDQRAMWEHLKELSDKNETAKGGHNE